MPRVRDDITFTPNQVRSRIRTVTRGYSGTGGGVSLAWLRPTVYAEGDGILSLERPMTAEEFTNWWQPFAYHDAYRISHAMQSAVNRKVGGVAHILVMKGNNLDKALIVPMWLGTHEAGPQSLVSLTDLIRLQVYFVDSEGNRIFNHNDLLGRQARQSIRNMRNMRNRNSSDSDPDSEEEEL